MTELIFSKNIIIIIALMHVWEQNSLQEWRIISFISHQNSLRLQSLCLGNSSFQPCCTSWQIICGKLCKFTINYYFQNKVCLLNLLVWCKHAQGLLLVLIKLHIIPGGGGVLPYMGYTGMCQREGYNYNFQAV